MSVARAVRSATRPAASKRLTSYDCPRAAWPSRPHRIARRITWVPPGGRSIAHWTACAPIVGEPFAAPRADRTPDLEQVDEIGIEQETEVERGRGRPEVSQLQHLKQ